MAYEGMSPEDLAAKFGGVPVNQGADIEALAQKFGGKALQPAQPQPNFAATNPEFSLFGRQITTPPTENGFNLPAAVIAAGRKLTDINQGIRDAKLTAYGTVYQALGLDKAAQDTADEQAKMSAERQGNAQANQQLDAVHPGSTLLGGMAPLLPLNLPAQAVVAGAEYGTPLERALRAGLTYGVGKATQMLGQKASSDYQASAADAATKTSQNAEREATLQAAQARGFVTPPSMTNPTFVNQRLESLAGKSATQQNASAINADLADNLTREAVGLPQNAPITSKAMQSLRRSAYNEGYNPVASVGQLPVSPEYNAALDAITAKASDASQSFPGAASPEIQSVVDSFRPPNGVFDSKHAIDASQQLRTDARALFMTPGGSQLAQTKIAISREIENELERQLAAKGQDGAQLLNNFRAARQKMAIAHDVEDAIRAGSGSVESRVFARKVQNQEPLSGNLKTIGDFANVFPKANQPVSQIGSQGVSAMDAALSSLLGVGGMAAGGPIGASAALLPMIRPATRAMLLSQPYQRLMTTQTPKAKGLLASKALDNEMAPWIAGLLASQASP